VERTTGELRCEARSVDEGTVLVVIGAIDVATVPELERALDRAIDEAPPTLTVDLRRVNHLDSRGVYTLVRALRRSRTAGVSLQLCISRAARIERVLELSGLRGALPVVEDY
jgi:anti-anti-sigma factor